MHTLIEWFEYQSRAADADGFKDRSAACTELADGLKTYSDFDLKELCQHLEKARSDPEMLANRCADAPLSRDVIETLILLKDLEGLTVTELKKFLKLTGEPTTGTKNDLLERAKQKVPAPGCAHSEDYVRTISEELTPNLYQRNAAWYPVVLFGIALSSFSPFLGASNDKLLKRLFTSMAYSVERGGLKQYLSKEGRNVENTLIGLWGRIKEHSSDPDNAPELDSTVRKATVGQLREVAKRLGIDHKGAKKELVDRIIRGVKGKPDTPPGTTNGNVVEARQKLSAIREEAAKGTSKATLERMFARDIGSLPENVILALGREYRFAETRRKKLLEHFWASIEKTSAQAMRK